MTVPLLTMGMTGSWEYLAGEIIYDHARSADETIAVVKGATLILSPPLASRLFPAIVLPPFVAELSLAFELLVKGVDQMEWAARSNAAGGVGTVAAPR